MAEAPLRAKRLPDSTHHVIVVLEAAHIKVPEFDTGKFTHEVLTYQATRETDDVAFRVQDASIIYTVDCPINGKSLGDAPYLKHVICGTTGFDHIDLEECRRRGVTVQNAPGGAVEAVADHAISLYFAARRRTVLLHAAMRQRNADGVNEWKAKGGAVHLILDSGGRPPLSCSQEVVAVFGSGPIGMKVLIAGRKHPSLSQQYDGPSRVPFDEALRAATVLMLALPLNAHTAGLISAPELATMRPEAVLVNVGRGALVDEGALVRALRAGTIAGAAIDVFAVEPAGSGADSALLNEDGSLEGLNLTLTPHVAYVGDRTASDLAEIVERNVRAVVAGEGLNLVT